MRKYTFFLVSLVIMNTLLADVFLLTLPRAGSHWLINGLSYLTQEPFSNDGLYPENCDPSIEFANPFFVDVDKSLPPLLVRTHTCEFVGQFSPEIHKLIVILRHPVEALSAWKKSHRMSSNPYSFSEDEVKGYLRYLKFFDAWKEENRLLIYYEDLIENPFETFSQALTFLGRSHERLEEFIQNIDENKKISLSSYSNHFRDCPASSKTEKIFYLKQVAPPDRIFVEKICLESEPSLTRKYLSRYLPF